MIKDTAVKKIRYKNQIKVLTAVMDSDGITRGDLVQKTDVSLMTISNVTEDLLSSGLLCETKGNSVIGRTPGILEYAGEKTLFAGFNLTETDGAEYYIYNIKGGIAGSENIQFDPADYQNGIRRLLALAAKNLTENKLFGIGVSVPGVYDEATDTVKTSLIDAQRCFHIKALFRSFFPNVHTVIAHDVNMAALAESECHPGGSLFYFYIGEGVGGTFLSGGKLILGENLLAGDLGQLLIGETDTIQTVEDLTGFKNLCRLLKLEEGCSIEAIDNALKQAAGHNPLLDSVLLRLSVVIYNICWQYNPKFIIINSPSKVYQELIVDKARAFLAGKKTEAGDSSALSTISTQILTSAYEGSTALFGLFRFVKAEFIQGLILG